jgi:hypothetical protein
MANAIICCFTGTFVKTLLVNAVQKKKPSNTLWKNVPLLNSSKVSQNYIYLPKTPSPINRKFYLAKGTEKFILGRYLLSGILLILLSLRPWGVAARPAILENRGAKSHFFDYFIFRARYLYLSYYRKCRACYSLHFLFFMFFCQINSFVVTACRNREFLLFLYFLFFSTPPQR